MQSAATSTKHARRLTLLAASLLGWGAIVSDARSDQPPADVVGAIEGDAIAIQGPMNVEVVHSQVRTVLRSGSDIRVKSGQARIELAEGGAISICGPAHLSVLKSGNSLTVALDSGTIHFRAEHGPAVVIYTPQIQAKPVAIGDAPQDILVGIEPSGVMCIRATSGAVRLEQQLTGQSIIVPQSGDIQLTNAQFESIRHAAGACECRLELVKTPQPKPPEASVLATADEVRKQPPPADTRLASAPAKPEPREEPVYQVYMPPLAYDASAKAQPEADPKFILLVRRVRVRPALVLRGRVEGEAAPPANQVAAANPAAATSLARTPPRTSNSNESVISRVRSFIRRIWNSAS